MYVVILLYLLDDLVSIYQSIKKDFFDKFL